MAEIHFDFFNFNTILLVLLILLVGGYLYYEIHKMKITINDIHSRLNYLLENNIHHEEPLSSVQVMEPVLNSDEINKTINENSNEDNIQSNIQDVGQMDDQDISDIKRQMIDDSDSESGSDSDSRSESSSDSESRISQSEIEKDYGKNAFEQENNSASIDDILSDKHIITDNSLSDILNVDSDLTKIDEFIQNIKSDKEETKEKDYNDMTVSELKKVLVDMKLPVSGNKTKLVERILENKK